MKNYKLMIVLVMLVGILFGFSFSTIPEVEANTSHIEVQRMGILREISAAQKRQAIALEIIARKLQQR